MYEHSGAVQTQMEPWRVRRLVVTDSQHFIWSRILIQVRIREKSDSDPHQGEKKDLIRG